MRVLIACEYSGRVRDAFARKGHYAVSADLLPSDTNGWHYRGNVLNIINRKWDLLIAFPPCTHLSSVGASEWKIKQENGLQEEAIHFFLDLWECGIPRIAIENPSGIMSTVWRRPNQYVQPWWFGDPWIKRTGIWLSNLPLLEPTEIVRPRGHWVDGGNMFTKRLSKPLHEGAYMEVKRNGGSISTKGQSHERAKTFRGLARAMAEQWSTC